MSIQRKWSEVLHRNHDLQLIRMFVPNLPKFRNQWLLQSTSAVHPWLLDDQWVPTGHRVLYTHARTGIYAALDTYPRPDGDSGPVTDHSPPIALVPAFIPYGVVWAILESGYRVRYYPVNEDLSLPTETVTERIREVNPAAIVFVHYLGFVDPDFQTLAKRAHEDNTIVIEDCARGLFSRDVDGNLLGSTGDVSVYSLHKSLSVPNGGLTITTDRRLPHPTDSSSEGGKIAVSAAISGARAIGFPPQSITNTGSESPPPEHRPPDNVWPNIGPGRISAKGLAAVRPESIASIRRERYIELRTRLTDYESFRVITPPAHAGAVPYGVGISFESDEKLRQRVFGALHRNGLPAEKYTWPLLHRSDTPYRKPGANSLRKSMLVIPTHQQVPESAIDRIVSTIDRVNRIRSAP